MSDNQNQWGQGEGSQPSWGDGRRNPYAAGPQGQPAQPGGQQPAGPAGSSAQSGGHPADPQASQSGAGAWGPGPSAPGQPAQGGTSWGGQGGWSGPNAPTPQPGWQSGDDDPTRASWRDDDATRSRDVSGSSGAAATSGSGSGATGPRRGSHMPLIAGMTALVLASGIGGAVLGHSSREDVAAPTGTSGTDAPGPDSTDTPATPTGPQATQGGPSLTDTDVAAILRKFDDIGNEFDKKPSAALLQRAYMGEELGDTNLLVRAATNGLADKKPLGKGNTTSALNKGVFRTGMDAKGEWFDAYVWSGDSMNSFARYWVFRRPSGSPDWKLAMSRGGTPRDGAKQGPALEPPTGGDKAAASALAAMRQYVEQQQPPTGFTINADAKSMDAPVGPLNRDATYTCQPQVVEQILQGVEGRPDLTEVTGQFRCTQVRTGKDLAYDPVDQRYYQTRGSFSKLSCSGVVTATLQTNGRTAELMDSGFKPTTACIGTR